MAATTYDVQPLRTKEEIDDLKWSLRRYCSERDYFLFVFGINTGLRVSDILPLKVGDIRGKTHVTIVQKKNGKSRRVFIKNLSAVIENYTKGMNDEDYLFPSRKGNKPISETQAYRALVKAGDQLDRSDIGTHTMRKTFGYHHYKRNKDIAVLQEIFSHSAPSITKRYIGITQEELDESIDFVL
ncbi:site-specific integrase [Priestia megaterium]|uniref:site-specific integrase n=1 Tax=Priestia megaterium TaxID=1404 RepID=UPI00336AF6F0